jgi:hypothetical protein
MVIVKMPYLVCGRVLWYETGLDCSLVGAGKYVAFCGAENYLIFYLGFVFSGILLQILLCKYYSKYL